MAPTSPTTSAPHSVNRLARWKLTEPVRLYLYTVLLVLVAGLQLAGWVTGEWREFAATSALLLLGIPAGAEAARASVYSPRSVVQAVRRAAGQ